MVFFVCISSSRPSGDIPFAHVKAQALCADPTQAATSPIVIREFVNSNFEINVTASLAFDRGVTVQFPNSNSTARVCDLNNHLSNTVPNSLWQLVDSSVDSDPCMVKWMLRVPVKTMLRYCGFDSVDLSTELGYVRYQNAPRLGTLQDRSIGGRTITSSTSTDMPVIVRIATTTTASTSIDVNSQVSASVSGNASESVQSVDVNLTDGSNSTTTSAIVYHEPITQDMALRTYTDSEADHTATAALLASSDTRGISALIRTSLPWPLEYYAPSLSHGSAFADGGIVSGSVCMKTSVQSSQGVEVESCVQQFQLIADLASGCGDGRKYVLDGDRMSLLLGVRCSSAATNSECNAAGTLPGTSSISISLTATTAPCVPLPGPDNSTHERDNLITWIAICVTVVCTVLIGVIVRRRRPPPPPQSEQDLTAAELQQRELTRIALEPTPIPNIVVNAMSTPEPSITVDDVHIGSETRDARLPSITAGVQNIMRRHTTTYNRVDSPDAAELSITISNDDYYNGDPDSMAMPSGSGVGSSIIHEASLSEHAESSHSHSDSDSDSETD
jgi:hypothetical protein